MTTVVDIAPAGLNELIALRDDGLVIGITADGGVRQIARLEGTAFSAFRPAIRDDHICVASDRRRLRGMSRDGQLLYELETDADIMAVWPIDGASVAVVAEPGLAAVFQREGQNWHYAKLARLDQAPAFADCIGFAGDDLVLMDGFKWTRYSLPDLKQGPTLHPEHTGMLAQMQGATGLSRSGRLAFHYWDFFIIWDSASGETLVDAECPLPADKAALSENGCRLAISGRHIGVAVVSESGNVLRSFPQDSPIRALVIDDEGTSVAFLDARRDVGWYDVETGQNRVVGDLTKVITGVEPD